MNLELTLEIITGALQSSPYFSIFTALVTLASTVAAITPTPKNPSLLSALYKIIDLFALNIGKAKDKGE